MMMKIPPDVFGFKCSCGAELTLEQGTWSTDQLREAERMALEHVEESPGTHHVSRCGAWDNAKIACLTSGVFR